MQFYLDYQQNVVRFILASKLERCHAGDTVCLARVIEWYMHALKDGNKDLGIVPLDPMYFKYLKFLEGTTIIDWFKTIYLSLIESIISINFDSS